MGAWGIDLGTANTVICHPRDGVVYDEPSMVASRTAARGRNELVAIGREAASLEGRVGGVLAVARPLVGGAVLDLEGARSYLRAVLTKVGLRGRAGLLPTRTVVSVPLGATTLERRALLEVAEEAGLRRVTSVGAPVAAALGSGIDPMDGRVHLVADIGAGTAEIAALCYGQVVAARSLRTAGDAMVAGVRRWLRDEHGLAVGVSSAELATSRATLPGPGVGEGVVVDGIDLATGRPRLCTVEAQDIAAVIAPWVEEIVTGLATCLDGLPVQGVGDVLDEGVLLAGGASLAAGMAERLEDALGFPIKRADDPSTCVATGLALAGDRRDVLAAFGI